LVRFNVALKVDKKGFEGLTSIRLDQMLDQFQRGDRTGDVVVDVNEQSPALHPLCFAQLRSSGCIQLIMSVRERRGKVIHLCAAMY
jgi:hypothetical protein